MFPFPHTFPTPCHSRLTRRTPKNDYSWCTSDFVTSGWDKKVEAFTGYGIPIFLSEYGCIANKRNFGELESLMHSNMTPVYSGGLMYEYSMEPNKFGIVEIEGGVDQTGERKELEEFAAFAEALEKWPAPTGDGGYNPTNSASECPQPDDHWLIENATLPAIPQGALKVCRSLASVPLYLTVPAWSLTCMTVLPRWCG